MRSSRARASSPGRRSCDEADARRRGLGLPGPRSGGACRSAATGTHAGVGRRVHPGGLARVVPRRTGDRRARQLRRRRPRPRPPPDRRDEDLSASGSCTRVGPAPSRRGYAPAASSSGARSPAIAPVVCKRRCASGPVRSNGAGAVRQLRPPPSSDSISMKTLKMSRKIEAASSGAASICPAWRSRWKSYIVYPEKMIRPRTA